MAHDNRKAFDATVDIVKSFLSDSKATALWENPQVVTKFTEAIYNKLVELEDKSREFKNS